MGEVGMRVGRWGNGVAFLVALAAIACAARAPQSQTLPVAWTACYTGGAGEAVAVSWIRDEIKPIDDFLSRAHEAEHRRQIRSYADCDEYKAWLDGHRALSEAMAFCAMAGAGVAVGYYPDPKTAVAHVTAVLWQDYPELALTPDSAGALMKRVCNTGD
jgi:hypothetical protein